MTLVIDAIKLNKSHFNIKYAPTYYPILLIFDYYAPIVITY